jgi:serine/threonine protein phosphatase 1
MACYVIGDIHGCLEELACLVDQIPIEKDDRVVFLGDYVDRGPNSKGVISYLLEVEKRPLREIVFLSGNHEEMFLSFLGLGGGHGDMFLYNGGGSTLASYGIPQERAFRKDNLAVIPPNHLAFLTGLKRYHVVESFLCVHAGIQPTKPLEQQTAEELFWIRDEFILNRHRLPYTVLFGHTPQREVLYHLPFKIGLDTGLVYGNKLSCLEIEEKVLFQISRGSRRVTRTLAKNRWDKSPPLTTP